MKKIFYIMGRSCVGKTYLFNKLKSDPVIKRHCKILSDYTTRPMREGEINGDEHIFVSEEAFKSLNPIESRSYSVTLDGEQSIWRYATCADNIDVEENYYIAIGMLAPYQKIQEYFFNRYGEDVVIPIYIIAKDEDILANSLIRESNSTKNYDEMCRRFLSDKNDYKKENIDEVGITNKNTYLNRYDDNDELYNMIAKDILSNIIINEQGDEEE